MRNWLWYLIRNSAVLRACSSLFPSNRPEMTRLPANKDAPLLPTRPLQMMRGLMPRFCRLSAASQPAAPPPIIATSAVSVCMAAPSPPKVIMQIRHVSWCNFAPPSAHLSYASGWLRRGDGDESQRCEVGRSEVVPRGCPARQRPCGGQAAAARPFHGRPEDRPARIPADGEAVRPQPEGYHGAARGPG